MESKIYINCTIEDKELGSLIKDLLENRYNISVTIFSNNEQMDKHWIKNKNKKSVIVLILLTSQSFFNSWIYWEGGGAYHNDIKTIVLLSPKINFDIANIPIVKIENASSWKKVFTEIEKLATFSNISKSKKCQEKYKKEIDLLINSITTKKTNWLDFAEKKIISYINNVVEGRTINIRIMCYSGINLISKLLEIINSSLKIISHTFNLKILIRNEYFPFSNRINNEDYNRIIRDRISYSKYILYNQASISKDIKIEVRDYDSEPNSKLVIIDEEFGFLGLYQIEIDHQLDRYKRIPSSYDWISDETYMAFFDKNQYLITNYSSWFDSIWKISNERLNESYRFLRNNILWSTIQNNNNLSLVDEKKYLLNENNSSFVPNLYLPRYLGKSENQIIDSIGCSIIDINTNKTIVIADIYNNNDYWEGFGKTSALLELLEIKLIESQYENILNGTLSDEPFLEINRNYTNSVRMISSDFIWLNVKNGCLEFTSPQGEYFIALWDLTRCILRNATTWMNTFKCGNHRNFEETRIALYRELLKLNFDKIFYNNIQKIKLEELILLLKSDEKDKSIIETISEHDSDYHEYLKKFICNGIQHKSQFWSRSLSYKTKFSQIASEMINSLTEFPIITLIKGSPPIKDLKEIIQKRINL